MHTHGAPDEGLNQFIVMTNHTHLVYYTASKVLVMVA